MKRAKLRYSIAQNKKGLHDMLYCILTSDDNWIYFKTIELKKAKDILNELENKETQWN